MSCDGAEVSCTSASSDGLRNRFGERVPPLSTFYLYLTAGCNLACNHCWITPRFMRDGGTGGHLDLERLEQGIVEGKPLGLASCKLTGGEPTLHPQFIELCQLLARHGLEMWMESNGVLLTPEMAREARRLGMTFCSISLDGATAQTHDHQRNVRGAFEGARAGIRALVDAGIRVQAIFTLTRDNAHELFDVFTVARDFGCSSVKVNLLEPTGRGQLMTVHERGLGVAELIELGRRCEALEDTVGIPVLYSWPPAFWHLRRLLRRDAESCGVRNILGVLADGSLALCGIGRHLEELVYGAIGRSNLAEVWLEHPKLRELRAFQPSELEGVCGQCLHAPTCFGACRASVYNATRSLRAPFMMCQRAYEAGLFPASRLRPRQPGTEEGDLACAG